MGTRPKLTVLADDIGRPAARRLAATSQVGALTAEAAPAEPQAEMRLVRLVPCGRGTCVLPVEGDGSEPDDEGRATSVAADAGDSDGGEGEGSAAGGDIGGAHNGGDVRLPSER